MSEPAWVEWTPEWNLLVVGRYERPERGPSGMPEPQKIVAVCKACKARCRCPAVTPCACGAEWRGVCSTGIVRSHIARFAHLHLHRDPLAPPPKIPA